MSADTPTTNYQLPTTGPLLVIVGETASGKSQLAIRLAQRFDGEIISADSWQVYKGFDIGTAKPAEAELKRLKHHLINVVEAEAGFNAALFKNLANKAILDIQNRGKLPILAGGTGLYIDSVIYDYGFLPVASEAERAAHNAQSLPGLLKEATAAGISLEGIDVRNKRRVIRAIEAGGQRPTNSKLRADTLIVGIRMSREDLLTRIAGRVDKMLAAGLEQEVKSLWQTHGWDIEPMKGIGYREWREYFDGSQTLAETRGRIISATIGLAKRQRTWFKRDNGIQWLNDPKEAVDLATTFLNKKQ